VRVIPVPAWMLKLGSGRKVYRAELICFRIFKVILLWEEGMKPSLDGSALGRQSR